MTAKRSVPKKPESFIISDDEEDNVFFALNIDDEFGEKEAFIDLSLVVDVKGDNEDDSMEEFYSVLLDSDYLRDLKKWLKQALEYLDYVEEHGVPISLILGEQDDGDMEER